MTNEETRMMDELYEELKADGTLEAEQERTNNMLTVAHHHDQVMSRAVEFDPYENRIAFCMFLDDIDEHIKCLDEIKMYPNSGLVETHIDGFNDEMFDDYLAARIDNFSDAMDPYEYRDTYRTREEGFDAAKSWLYDKKSLQQLFDSAKQVYEETYNRPYKAYDYPQPCGGDKTNYMMFYTGPGYPDVTEDVMKEYGIAVDMKHQYWGTESSHFNAMYNGDTYVIYRDIHQLPDAYKEDAKIALSQVRNLPRHLAERTNEGEYENTAGREIDLANNVADYEIYEQ